MNKVILAGATGYLGSHLALELKNQNISFKAIARNEKRLLELGLDSEQIIKAEVTLPLLISKQLEGAEVLISTVGITRQKDGLSYMDVDYQANVNLLNAAKKAGIKKFIYVSAINGARMRHLKIMEAKERFVDDLKASGMKYLVVRPNGFFSDMKDFLDMAKNGKVYLFGHGDFKLNPIHGADLARAIIESMSSNHTELPIGGPDILTQNEIAVMALEAYGKPPKVTHFPDWIRLVLIHLVRTFTSSKTYGPIEFFLSMMGQDNIAPRFGIRRLKAHFKQEVDRLN